MPGYGKADYTIKNGLIEAGINKKGAEMVSLVRIKDGRQYMWNGYVAYWNRILWKVVHCQQMEH